MKLLGESQWEAQRLIIIIIRSLATPNGHHYERELERAHNVRNRRYSASSKGDEGVQD